MATVPVYNAAGQPAGELELAADVFGLEPNTALLHQAVVTTLANQRQGSADTKTRGEVKHTTRKLFRQKGTGRARQGMRSAPHWKGGGVVFGPHPRDYRLDLPKKMRRKALLCALSARVTDGVFTVVDDFGIQQGKTKEAIALLTALQLATTKKLVVVISEYDEMIARAFRNLPNVISITNPEGLGTLEVLHANRLLFTRDSLVRLQALKQEPVGVARWQAKQDAEGGAA